MKDFWEQRYSEKGWAYGTEPNQFLASQRGLLKPGTSALVCGDGEGRNGVWLAQHGLNVTSVDYSAAGIKKTRELAIAKGVKINVECADLTQWHWPTNTYDVVVSIYLHFVPTVRQAMHRNMIAALKPGGLLILEAFNKNQVRYQSGGPRDATMLYSPDELHGDLTGVKFDSLEEGVEELREGRYHVGPGAVIRVIAHKPAR